MPPFKLQAREVIWYAKRNKIQLTRMMATLTNGQVCVVGLMGDVVNVDYKLGIGFNGFNKEGIGQAFGITGEDVRQIERGFEDWCADNPNNPYYKLGQNIARLAGL